MMTGYELPDDGFFRTINFSGGRTSGFMLHEILRANGGEVPDDRAAVVFCNTGKERPETLDFVRDCGERWGVPITWLEFRYDGDADKDRGERKLTYEVVDHETASRDGEPFSQLISMKAMLPTPVMRFCTSELKVRTIERWLRRHRAIAPSRHRAVLGLRYDEPQRWRKRMMDAGGCSSDFPLVHAKAGVDDVTAFWARQNFDLGVTSDQGNCDLCFLKGRAKLVSLIRETPSAADWWIAAEEAVGRKAARDRALRRPDHAQFRKGHSFADLQLIATSNQEFDFGAEDADMDCFCTD